MPIENREVLSAVLDELIPPQPKYNLAGAGRDEVVQGLEAMLTQSGMDAMVNGGLAHLNASAQERFDEPYVQLGTDDRVLLLQAIEREQEHLIPILLTHSFFIYYAQPDVLEHMGYDPRPPFPKGHDLDVGDEELLRNLKQRVGGPEEARP